MSESVTLYEFLLGSLDAEGVPQVKSVHEVGLFHLVPWCKAHDSSLSSGRVCYLRLWGSNHTKMDACEIVERWMESIEGGSQ